MFLNTQKVNIYNHLPLCAHIIYQFITKPLPSPCYFLKPPFTTFLTGLNKVAKKSDNCPALIREILLTHLSIEVKLICLPCTFVDIEMSLMSTPYTIYLLNPIKYKAFRVGFANLEIFTYTV